MMAIVGVYYKDLFKVQYDVIQGYPLTPIIFNVVVYAVLRHWVAVVAEAGG